MPTDPQKNPFLKAHVIALEAIILAAAVIEGIKYLIFLIKR